MYRALLADSDPNMYTAEHLSNWERPGDLKNLRLLNFIEPVNYVVLELGQDPNMSTLGLLFFNSNLLLLIQKWIRGAHLNVEEKFCL